MNVSTIFMPRNPMLGAHGMNYAKKLVEQERAVVFVAKTDSKAIGYAIGRILERPPIYSIGQIGDICDCYVKPRYRRHNIGKRLVKETLKWFRTQGVSYPGGQVDARNINSIRFWKHFGFNAYMLKMKMRLRGD